MKIGFVSVRFAGLDGVSLEAAKLATVLRNAGHEVAWFAGELGAEFAPGVEFPPARFDSAENLELQQQCFGVEHTSPAVLEEIDRRADVLVDAIREFMTVSRALRENPHYKFEQELIKSCSRIEERLTGAELSISQILEIFKIQTEDMWKTINRQSFHSMEQNIIHYQRDIGGTICALTIKMKTIAYSRSSNASLPTRLRPSLCKSPHDRWRPLSS